MKLITKIGKKVGKNIPSMTLEESIEGLKIIVEAFKENNRVVNEEQTKREEIRAQKEVYIEEIRTKKEILLDYFDNIFRERREIYQKFFKALDKGIEKENIELIQYATNAIVTIAMDSPLKDLQKFQKDNKIGKEVKKIENFKL